MRKATIKNKSYYRINIQNLINKKLVPSSALLRKWVKEALRRQRSRAEVTIRVVNRKEISQLNRTYRHQKGATNVLSFPFFLPKDIRLNIPVLGDVIICAEVVNKEAKEQHKKPQAHWAHMVIHGIFHLLGFDHQTNRQAKIMETLEIKVMQKLGFDNPYKA